MKQLKYFFWSSSVLSPLFIIWGAYEFAREPAHGSARIFFIIGLILAIKSLALLFMMKRNQVRQNE
jgi:hypothetical protein